MQKKKAVKGKSKKQASVAVLVNFILDRSGSMATCVGDVIGGFNKYIGDLKADPATKYTMTLTQFDDVIETVYTAKAIGEVDCLSEKTFVPRGSTALLDAVGKTISAIGSQVDDKTAVLTVVFTDGGENASREFTNDKIKSLIKEKQKGNWTFVFLGANQDSWANAGRIGMFAGNVQNYNTTQTVGTFAALATSTRAYSRTMAAASRRGAPMRSMGFFGKPKARPSR